MSQPPTRLRRADLVRLPLLLSEEAAAGRGTRDPKLSPRTGAANGPAAPASPDAAPAGIGDVHGWFRVTRSECGVLIAGVILALLLAAAVVLLVRDSYSGRS
jgi:hypothetical protein